MARSPTWSRLGLESVPWSSRYNRDDLTRAQWEGSRGPYEASVTPAIASARLTLGSAAATSASDASSLLSRFDSELGTTGLPFASILLRSESSSSSEIEHLTSGARAIAEAELGERESGNAGLIVRNAKAMTAAIELADHIDHASLIEMQRALLGHHAPALTGGYRDEQVWIGGGGVSPHTAVFVPPRASRVPAAMADLVQFIDRDDIPALAHAAVAHAQFETIHPFPDGNGRTGRALVQAMLRNKRLTTNVTVPVSAGLLHDVDGYFQALTAYRTGDPDPIVLAFSDAAAYAVRNARSLVAEIERIRATWMSAMSTLRSDANARRVAELAVGHPVLNGRLISESLSIPPPTAYRAIEALVERRILRPANSQNRNRIWIADDIIAALDDFAARAGRRRSPSA